MNGGAVAYLTQSIYGRSKEEIMVNNYYTNWNSPYKTAITGLAGNDVTSYDTSSLSDMYAYNTINGMKASTTGNITGVYDLSGGLYERVANYISNGNERLTRTGNTSGGSSGGLMGATNEANLNGYQTLSRRDYTIYPYSNSSDDNLSNYNAYKGLLTSTYGYGDAILEISSQSGGNYSWNYDYSYFVSSSSPFFYRGGSYNNGSASGLFIFHSTTGAVYIDNGFRAVLIAE